jgi:hypothetical protein
MDITLKIALIGAIAVIIAALIKLLGDLISKGSSGGLIFTMIIVILALIGGAVFVLSVPPPASPKTITASVQSNITWQDSGIHVQPGQILMITASGFINTWGGNPIGDTPNPNGQPQNSPCPSEGNLPDCLINGELYGTLIGKISMNGAPFRIGAENTIAVTASGNLYLAINDNEPYFDDNSGTYSVTITIK